MKTAPVGDSLLTAVACSALQANCAGARESQPTDTQTLVPCHVCAVCAAPTKHSLPQIILTIWLETAVNYSETINYWRAKRTENDITRDAVPHSSTRTRLVQYEPRITNWNREQNNNKYAWAVRYNRCTWVVSFPKNQQHLEKYNISLNVSDTATKFLRIKSVARHQANTKFNVIRTTQLHTPVTIWIH